MIKAIPRAEMLRDQALYRKLMRVITFDEKIHLMETVGNYAGYQKVLFVLAERYSLKIPPAK